MNRVDFARRNFWTMIIEGGFYFTGYTFFDVYVVIPVFVDAMTGDLRLAGLAATLKFLFFIIPQLLMGHFTPRVKSIPLLLGISGLISRACYFVVPIVLLTGLEPYIKVLTLYFMLVVASFGDGVTHVPWLDILGRTIPAEKRGRLLGYQQLLGGIGGLFAGALLKYVLAIEGISISTKYAVVFSIGATFLTVAGILLFFVKDTERSAPREEQGVFTYLSRLHKYVLENKAYIRFMITQCIFYFGGLASPIYILFAKKHFSLGEGTVTTLMFLQIVGSLAGGIIWGNLSHKMGNKITIQISILVNILVSAVAAFLALVHTGPVMALLVIVAFGSGTLLGAWLGYTNYLLEIISEEERPVYIAITSTIQFPFTLMSFIGGVLANLIGFFGVFFIVAVFMVLSLITSFRLEGKGINIRL